MFFNTFFRINNLMEFHQPGSIVETKPPKAQTKSSNSSVVNRSQSKLLNESARSAQQAATPPALKKRVRTPTPKTNNFFDNEELVSNSINRSYSHENDEPLPPQSKTDTIRSDRSSRAKETPKSSRKLTERIEADEEKSEHFQKPKARKEKMQAFAEVDDENQVLLKDIFTVDGRPADVEMDKYRIFWNYVSTGKNWDKSRLDFIDFIIYYTILFKVMRQIRENRARKKISTARHTKFRMIEYSVLSRKEWKQPKKGLPPLVTVTCSA
jgi:hypothetical protein